MPLMSDAPPAGAERIIDAAIAELLGHGALALARGSKPSVSTPIQLYHLGADAIAERKGLAGAVAVGWLATVRNGSEVLGSLELISNPRAKPRMPKVKFGGFTSGPLHRGLAEALDAADRRAGRARITAAVLRAPAVYLLALWLKDGDADDLVPVAPAPPPLTANEPIAAQRALDALQAAAEAALEGDPGRS
jgi:hypothetical protein